MMPGSVLSRTCPARCYAFHVHERPQQPDDTSHPPDSCLCRFLVYEQYDYALLVLFVAGVTDGLDGTIARVANQRTQLGAVLDPLADKLLLTTGFITLSFMHLIPLWITILVVSRDLILMLGTVVAQYTETHVDISPTVLGKSTTLIQLATLVLVVFFASRQIDLSMIQPLLYVMAIVTLSSGFHYLYRGYAHVTASGA